MLQGSTADRKDHTPATSRKPKVTMGRIDFAATGPLIALILLLLLGALLNPTFISLDNLENVLARSAFIGIIAIGATFVITGGGIDLSVGSMAAFAAAAMIVMINTMAPITGPGAATIAIGVAAGFAMFTLTPFRPTLYFGLLIAATSAAAALCDLVVLPALLLLRARRRVTSGSAG